MKRIICLLIAAIFIISCNNEAKEAGTGSTEKMSSAAANLPYEMEYKSWEMGDQGNMKLVLDMYKNWEDNKLDAVASAFGDTSFFESPSGGRTIVPAASLPDSLKVWRSYMGTVTTNIVTGLSLHSPDKNEDWVLLWSINNWTGSNGKADSSFSNDNWQIKNGKIAGVVSLEKKLVQNP